mmetsp:Transcript_2484/g.4050  ORF Transcript_2484/g.4050 Transcript_2484/m.4050 type:complete len:125 (-) Transcript_2484:10-384(-)
MEVRWPACGRPKLHIRGQSTENGKTTEVSNGKAAMPLSITRPTNFSGGFHSSRRLKIQKNSKVRLDNTNFFKASNIPSFVTFDFVFKRIAKWGDHLGDLCVKFGNVSTFRTSLFWSFCKLLAFW